MKKSITSLILVAVGSGLWFTLSNSARFSIKKWDVKFETTLRHTLNETGLTDADVISSVHEMVEDNTGSWLSHSISVKDAGKKNRKKLKKALKKAGAQVEERVVNEKPAFIIRRGDRIYQRILFL